MYDYLDFLDRRGPVWRRRNEGHANVTVRFHDIFGAGSVMVWDGIATTDRTSLHIVKERVTGQYYQDNM